ncbi:MAG: 50S ribosomal protein L32 [Deltaproteobacteria bacterium]|nr:50S ribosomal protein L32 [Deltaproteobacteria bacterium]
MAVPKRKLGRSRRDSRRAQWMRSVAIPNVISCAGCGAPKVSHRVCEACGAYDGRQVMPKKEEEAGE